MQYVIFTGRWRCSSLFTIAFDFRLKIKKSIKVPHTSREEEISVPHAIASIRETARVFRRLRVPTRLRDPTDGSARIYMQRGRGKPGRSTVRRKLRAREADGDLSKQITVNPVTSYEGKKRVCSCVCVCACVCRPSLLSVELIRNKHIFISNFF